jgi:hypothetical protein
MREKTPGNKGDDLSPLPHSAKYPRRRFMREATTAMTFACLSPSMLMGCRATPGETATTSYGADTMEQALEMMKGLAPLTNHGPMAAEALVALGCANRVVSFVEAYKKRFNSSYPDSHQTITRENWREALGDGSRVADWANFFKRELKEAQWSHVLERWSDLLAPGLAAAAAHGIIRTAHAVRSLSVKETELRRGELAEGLAYWAAYYQPLPEAPTAKARKLRPLQAISHIPLLPTGKRLRGSIMAGLRSLNDYSPFTGVADLVETTGQPEPLLSEITETFATVYLKNVSPQNHIALIHAVTGPTSLRSLLPFLSTATTQRILRYGWQTAAAIYSVYGAASTTSLPEVKEINRHDLIERAAESQEEHAIKFTEACLREYALNPKPIYLQAAQDAITRLA